MDYLKTSVLNNGIPILSAAKNVQHGRYFLAI